MVLLAEALLVEPAHPRQSQAEAAKVGGRLGRPVALSRPLVMTPHSYQIHGHTRCTCF
jgi:hypothetical protein